MVVVGNAVAGGAGKTPIAMAVAAALRARGVKAHMVSGGYGGTLHGPLLVDPAYHGFDRVGDEALLLAKVAPSWIARKRGQAARAAWGCGAQAVVLDDGLQHPGLRPDLALMVVDARQGLGNDRVIPAGPLREPFDQALARCHGVVLLGGDATPALMRRLSARPVLRAHLVPSHDAPDLHGLRVVAFAGIGRPQKFFDTCRQMGAEVVKECPYPDHHPYTAHDTFDLANLAADLDAQLVTTEKDGVRLTPDLLDQALVLPMTVRWEEPEALDRLLDNLSLTR